MQVAKLLLEAGADPSCQNERGETPLQWAAWSGSEELVKLFLSHGANLHAVDHHPSAGWTALLCAAHQASILSIIISNHMVLTACSVDQVVINWASAQTPVK